MFTSMVIFVTILRSRKVAKEKFHRRLDNKEKEVGSQLPARGRDSELESISRSSPLVIPYALCRHEFYAVSGLSFA